MARSLYTSLLTTTRLQKHWRFKKWIAMLALPCSLVFAEQASLVGIPSVVDGDTIKIQDQRIRLYGIDAPEVSQTCKRSNTKWRCGHAAALALSDRLKSSTVTCEVMGSDHYNRIVAECFQGNTNINAWLVAEGWALDWPKYSKGDYTSQQKAAEASRQGIWDSTFEFPWEWRSRKSK